MYFGAQGAVWDCVSRFGFSTTRSLVFIYEIGVLWFIPQILILFTYTSVSLSLIRSIQTSSALSELKK